jgi:hypothetical protein
MGISMPGYVLPDKLGQFRINRDARKHADVGATRIADRDNSYCGTQCTENDPDNLTQTLAEGMASERNAQHVPMRTDMEKNIVLPQHMGALQMPHRLLLASGPNEVHSQRYLAFERRL